ncbi:sugar lactone lactonase YvrE [Promicromonospora sp. AC04]|uniref:hypothetical protein n=1 Tax=Promicromonospora sp. AC04 TaxID=2135723 RepID=UPI000D3ABF8B|nr:hypothetical protein [Promicromonospora sp. AC04]PUB20794.1 sugar lactone lactonase YvrE [Promicromonospora sp. AC04]
MRNGTSALRAVLATAMATLLTTAPLAQAATWPVIHPRVHSYFDLSTGQQPENIVALPGEEVELSFAGSRQVARIRPDGSLTLRGTLPLPPDGGTSTPVLGTAIATGLVHMGNGDSYVGYAAGSPTHTGIWRIRDGAPPVRIAALPAASFPNGMAADENGKTLFVADSALGVIWRIPLSGNAPTKWLDAPELKPSGFLGANGLRVHQGSLWVTNMDHGTLVRIPFQRGGTAGVPEIRASGLDGIDDFAFVGRSQTVVAALNGANQVALVDPDGTHQVVLTAADGLTGPTSVAIHGSTLWVTSAAFVIQRDPNLLKARIVARG